MTQPREQVERFYAEVWDAHERSAIPALLHEDVVFRGSLGEETRGHGGVADYVDRVHSALGDYRCSIEDLVCEGSRVFARMTFTGVQRGVLCGFPPTGRRVSWSGAALFTFRGERIAEVWVLGDLKALQGQLG